MRLTNGPETASSGGWTRDRKAVLNGSLLSLCRSLRGSPRGAHASALLFSLVETAKVNGLEPWAYLNYLFENYLRAKTNEDILALLPHTLKQKNLKLAPPSIP